MTQASVLVVEDNDRERQITAETLREEGFMVEEAASGKLALKVLGLGRFDVVLSDLMMPGMSGEELLAVVRESYPATQVILLTAFGTIDSAVKAIKNGAFYYLTKPTDRETLVMTVSRAAELANLQQENQLLRTSLEGKIQLEGLIGQHPSILEVAKIVRKVAPSNATVLITGESGTGKELVARAIHRLSRRSQRPFVAINCSAIPDNLIENELFGHERGAFTGASERKTGLIEAAHQSTLFFDEIADLGTAMQAKLLRVIQEREIRRIGGHQSIGVDVRLVAATNRDLALEVEEGRFRDDLYYRINVVPINLPPLRERRSDIPLLANHFLNKFAALTGSRVREFSRAATEILLDYAWPGNVRQLQSAVERAVLLCEGEVIQPEDLPDEVLQRRNTGRHGDRSRPDRFEIPSSGINLENFERDLILQAMEKSDWVIAKAAKLLGLSYRTLQYRLEKFNLRAPGPKAKSPEIE